MINKGKMCKEKTANVKRLFALKNVCLRINVHLIRFRGLTFDNQGDYELVSEFRLDLCYPSTAENDLRKNESILS